MIQRGSNNGEREHIPDTWIFIIISIACIIDVGYKYDGLYFFFLDCHFVFFFSLFLLVNNTTMIDSDTAFQKYQEMLQALISFLQVRKNKYACIGAAIACVLSRHIYKSIALPPDHLRSFPQVSTFQVLNSFRKFESVPSRIKRLINPITDTGYSFYMVCVW